MSVSDTGPGISKDDMSKLFTKFFQGDASTKVKYGGTGLGLSICKEIINFHRGKIWVESKGLGKGSTFYFTLPAGGKQQKGKTTLPLKGKQQKRVKAKSLFCFWAVNELGISLTEIARRLDFSVPGVGYSVERGEIIARENGCKLIEKEI